VWKSVHAHWNAALAIPYAPPTSHIYLAHDSRALQRVTHMLCLPVNARAGLLHT